VSTPLLIVGHGTPVARGAAAFHSLVDRVRGLAAGRLTVAGGFLELSEPAIAEALAELQPAPGTQVVALPLMLLAAGHSKRDIPKALAERLDHHPDLDLRYGRPLGPHPTLVELLERRVESALAGADRAGASVILAGQGSSDPEGNADLAKVSRLLWESGNYQAVETAYLSTTTPDLPTALDRAYTLGARRIVVAPHLLFPGVLSERIQNRTREWANDHPSATVTVAEVIGDCDDLAGLVLERYWQALGSGVALRDRDELASPTASR
jgi:sirohydrochlorin cobaltochelatase